MSMDEQIVDLMRDQFKALSEKIDGVHDAMREHVEEDKRYWNKIEQQEGQVGLLKFVLSASGMSAAAAWIYNMLKH
jgi:hypothetical protein